MLLELNLHYLPVLTNTSPLLLLLPPRFHTFFHQIDNFKTNYFLWVTAGGMYAAQPRDGPMSSVPKELDDDELGEDGDEGSGNGEG